MRAFVACIGAFFVGEEADDTVWDTLLYTRARLLPHFPAFWTIIWEERSTLFHDPVASRSIALGADDDPEPFGMILTDCIIGISAILEDPRRSVAILCKASPGLNHY